ncbi:hypothetical protein MPSEU_001066500 [Mayamaea pseudoterrestris]|nr:hypothetical protein MPSEU_001066500 [Mayamaea pseudoterrestris]
MNLSNALIMSGISLINVFCRVNGFSPCRRAFQHGQRSFSLLEQHAHRRKVAVIGGGLAGLATVFHLTEKESQIEITIFDKNAAGTGGASSVAGGLLHPLSPRGKLVHCGMEGLEASNRLIDAARKYDGKVQMRDELFRVAMNPKQADDLKATAELYPNFSEWISSSDLGSQGILHHTAEGKIMGALRLHNGCQVLHVPSYLQALWRHFQAKNFWVDWKLVGAENSSAWWQEQLAEFDALVLSCGDGLFSSFFPADHLPIQLVHGQSIEMRVPKRISPFQHGLLSGKYISPLPDESLVLVGASHEFQIDPLTRDDLMVELQTRTHDMAPYVWSEGVLERVTRGTRVQSQRGKHGRLPIIGRVDHDAHPNVWLFTGLSSRGLLYHALYGEMLAEAILADSEGALRKSHSDIFWWRRRGND